MKNRIGRCLLLMLVLSFVVLAPTWASWAQEIPPESSEMMSASQWETMNKRFVCLMVFTVLIGSILALIIIWRSLRRTEWTLADALSEEVEITSADKDKDGNPIMRKELHASSSRLIALMGTIVILLMFVGFGMFVLYSFGMTGEMPKSIDKVIYFLLSGLTLFAPYAANKFSDMFERKEE
jgi:hypothetical protein